MATVATGVGTAAWAAAWTCTWPAVWSPRRPGAPTIPPTAAGCAPRATPQRTCCAPADVWIRPFADHNAAPGRADRREHRRRGGGRPSVGDPRRTRARRDRALRLRPDDHRGAVSGQQAGQRLSADAVDRVQLAAVHGQRGDRLQTVARIRWPAWQLRRLGYRRPVFGAGRQYGRLPPDPVPAHDGAGPGRREAGGRRSPAHGHRGQGRPAPAGPPGHRLGLVEWSAATGSRRGRGGHRFHRRVHRGLGTAGRPARRVSGRSRRRHHRTR